MQPNEMYNLSAKDKGTSLFSTITCGETFFHGNVSVILVVSYLTVLVNDEY